jgi:hypothetical protein
MSEEPEKDLSKMQDELDALNAKVTKQGAAVRQLKKDGAAADVIEEAVKALQALKISAIELSDKLKADEPQFNRKSFDDLIIRKMFVVPSFEIHGGVKGLFDLGPPACGLKVNSDKAFSTLVPNPVQIITCHAKYRLTNETLFQIAGCHD